jgi:chromosomal replication initiator protein
VVLTAPAAPAEMHALSPQLRSRLSGGLVVPIALPHLQARHEMLRALADQRHVQISEAAISRLAEALEVALPELDGALMFLQTASEGEPIDEPQVTQYLASRDERQQPTVRSIAAQTAKYFALKVTDLRSASRSRTIATARNLAMFLSRELTADSLMQIGGYFGGRDHATVLHGCRRAEKLLQTDQQMQQAVTRLRQLLHGRLKAENL